MSRLIKATLLMTLSILMVVVAWVILSAWAFKEPWLHHPWQNVSYLLHQEWFAVTLVSLIYVTAFLFIRWQLIARPIRCDILGYITDLQLQLDLEPLDSSAKKARIDALKGMLCGAAGRLNQIKPLDRIFWTRGQEVAAWGHVDDVECELAIMQPFDRVKARLETVERDLREIGSEDAGALADVIHRELARATSEDERLLDHRFRCLLYEALRVIDSDEDSELDDTMNWHNKTVWLTWLGVLLLISLEGTRRGGGGLFAAGATGGFLSRLMRAMKRVDDPTDSSRYWTTFFLSPLVGALAGWTGILLVELAVKLGVLGSAFNGVKIETGYESFALALAFLLGFSERLFDAIAGTLEAKVDKKAEAKGPSSPSSPPSPSSLPSPSSPSPSSPSSSSVSSRGDASPAGGS